MYRNLVAAVGSLVLLFTAGAGAAPPTATDAKVAVTAAPKSIEVGHVRPHVFHLASPEMRGRVISTAGRLLRITSWTSFASWG